MPATKTTTAPYTTTSPAAAYKHFLSAAKGVAGEAVRPCTIDVDLVRANAALGVAAVEPQRKLVKQKLRNFPWTEVAELPALTLALTFAADRVGAKASDGQIAAQLAAVRPMRELTLRQLEIFAELGMAPADRVRAIREGGGPIDTARDAVAIAALFHELGAAVAHKHPFAPAYLAQLAAHGEALLAALKPEGAPSAKAAPDPAANLRDRLFTLISVRYELLREAGVAAFGLKALDEHVPPLGSRRPAPAKTPPATTSPAKTPPAGGPTG
jgi:hypothetical protein